MIAWLETLAGQTLDRELQEAAEMGGASVAFAPDEGLPKETRAKLLSQQITLGGFPGSHRGTGGNELVTELDPDAATRCAIQLHQ